jgi:hypothetical protein
MTLIGRVNPEFALCVGELIELGVNPNVGLCVQIPVTIPLVDFDFNDADLDYTVPIVPPVVRDITPDSDVTNNFSDPIPVSWDTSWGAPDNCNLEVEIFYRFIDPVATAWTHINNQQPQTNSGEGDWDLSNNPFAGCRRAQIRVDLYDPQGRFLTSTEGDTFYVDVDPPQVIAVAPMPNDILCTGWPFTFEWTATDLCQLQSPQEVRVLLQQSFGGTWTLAGGINGQLVQHTVRIRGDLISDSNATVIIQARDAAGNWGSDQVMPVGVNQPADVNIGPDSIFPTLNGGIPGTFDALAEETGLGVALGVCPPNPGLLIQFDYVPQQGKPPLVDFQPGFGGETYTLPGTYDLDFNFPGEIIPFQFGITPAVVDPGKQFLAQIDTFTATIRYAGDPESLRSDMMLVENDSLVTGIRDPFGIDDEIVSLAPGYPNPFSSSTTFLYRLARPGSVRIRVYDVAGRLVKTLEEDVVSAGTHLVRWDGTDQKGRPAASGVYLVRLDADNLRRSARLVRMR